MSNDTVRPFLISKLEDGTYRLTVRETRYNSRSYPVVTSTLQDEIFVTMSSAKAFARENFRAEAGQFATK